jgi:hypothetical protein
VPPEKSSRTAPPLTLRTDPVKMGHITALARRFGVSKNDVVNILLADELARVTNTPLTPDDQATADSLVAAALAVLHADSEEARRP